MQVLTQEVQNGTWNYEVAGPHAPLSRKDIDAFSISDFEGFGLFLLFKKNFFFTFVYSLKCTLEERIVFNMNGN